MARMTLDDLRKLRESKKKEVDKRTTEGKDISIIIGMGTCGIAAGAKEAMTAFLEESDKAGLSGVIVRQTGCMGYCSTEPTVEVRMPGVPDTIYGRVSPEIARRIVIEHLLHGKLVSEHVFDKPSVDIIE
jgi:NADP-reducing hydrogenase subunit HndB